MDASEGLAWIPESPPLFSTVHAGVRSDFTVNLVFTSVISFTMIAVLSHDDTFLIVLMREVALFDIRWLRAAEEKEQKELCTREDESEYVRTDDHQVVCDYGTIEQPA